MEKDRENTGGDWRFTRREMIVVYILAAAFVIGVGVRYGMRHGWFGEGIEVVHPQKWEYTYILDLNEASPSELELLPGIGEVRARAIDEYRRNHGNFTAFDDLKKVENINKRTIDGLRGLIKIDDKVFELEKSR